MSSLAAVCLLLFLCLYSNLHACTCNRPLPLSQIQLLSPKDVKTPAGTDDKSVMEDNFRIQDESIDMNRIKGNKFRTTYSAKIFEDTAEEKELKREERMTLEKREAIAKGSGTVEDIVVMDYAQPHRKPPIHNKWP